MVPKLNPPPMPLAFVSSSFLAPKLNPPVVDVDPNETGAVVDPFGAPKLRPVLLSESDGLAPNPLEEKLIPASLDLAALRPKLIEDDVLGKVPAAATRLENFVLVESSPEADPGLAVEQQAQTFLSASFETRHVEHDHLALDDFCWAAAKSEFFGASDALASDEAPGFLAWQQAHAVLSLSLLVRHVEQDHLEALAAAALNKALTAAGFLAVVSVEAPGRLV